MSILRVKHIPGIEESSRMMVKNQPRLAKQRHLREGEHRISLKESRDELLRRRSSERAGVEKKGQTSGDFGHMKLEMLK